MKKIEVSVLALNIVWNDRFIEVSVRALCEAHNFSLPGIKAELKAAYKEVYSVSALSEGSEPLRLYRNKIRRFEQICKAHNTPVTVSATDTETGTATDTATDTATVAKSNAFIKSVEILRLSCAGDAVKVAALDAFVSLF